LDVYKQNEFFGISLEEKQIKTGQGVDGAPQGRKRREEEIRVDIKKLIGT
jgi:hypothetical protein